MLVIERFDFPRDEARDPPLVLRHSGDFEDARGPHDMAVLGSDTRSYDDVDKPMLVLSS